LTLQNGKAEHQIRKRGHLMNVGIIGSGVVAQTLGAGFLRHGHRAMLGTRDPRKLADWAARNEGGAVGSFAEAAAFGEVVVLAVRGSAAAEALRLAGGENVAGKPGIDTTNPLADEPPVNGVLKLFTRPDESLMEQLQREFPEARLVKAFSSVGNRRMVDPQFAEGRPSMFICGDDAAAKQVVRSTLDEFGWTTEDMGSVEAARAIEPLCVLWCIPGFLRNEWTHAFKVLR
jgi:8-hydroxy-5-deazaflavin:NADPH oxidoreductase